MRAPEVEQILAQATEAAKQGRERDARKLARYALSLAPDHPYALFRWGVEIIEEPERAKHYLRRAAALGWGDASLEFQVACVLFELGETDQALQVAKRAGRHVDEDFVYLPGLAGHTLASDLAKQGRSSDAMRVIRASLREAPADPGLLRLQAKIRGDSATPAFAP
jgi:tetratricopeptide (TPR) repeat protein